jgi:hypothetical protein
VYARRGSLAHRTWANRSGVSINCSSLVLNDINTAPDSRSTCKVAGCGVFDGPCRRTARLLSSPIVHRFGGCALDAVLSKVSPACAPCAGQFFLSRIAAFEARGAKPVRRQCTMEAV